MPTLEIRGVPINFPFEPYDLQKEYMAKVLECLQNSTNGVLESPTGTGKTLSLLCSSLAWLQTKKAQVQAQISAPQPWEGGAFASHLNEKLEELVGKAGSARALSGIPTIIYASRTHSQLSQVMQELKRTSYNYMKACVLGSRDQLCINPEVAEEQNVTMKNNLCQLKVKSRNCHYYNKFDRMKSDPKIRDISVMDIEDLNRLGAMHKFCPFYMSKELIKSADIIFVPYNYLLDFRIRKSLDMQLSNHIVIIDEAHNVERMCEEVISLQLKSSDVALAIDEVTGIMKMVSDEPLGFEDTPKDFTADDLCLLKQMFLDLEKEIDEISSTQQTLEGTFLMELFEKIGMKDNHANVIGLLSRITRYLATVNEGPFSRRGVGLQQFEDIFKILFMGTTEDYKTKVKKCCKVHMEVEVVKKKRQDNWLSKATTKPGGKILNYWCFSPGFGMNLLMNQGLKSLILTSGTLAPIKPLISELEINFVVSLENPHIVTAEQVCVRIISNGPDGEILNCNYQNRDNPKYLNSLGRTILNLSKVIPNGLLIFFPSYPIMQNCQDSWQRSGIWSSLNSEKAVYVEPRNKDAFNTAMQEYYAKIGDPALKGAVFMGVCRGKVAEGLDFADINGRAVIIVGLPYPPLKDPRVILKRKYLDVCNMQDKEFLRGEEWYSLEASRAVNQAIGRVIRHQNDYGAILLLDSRFNSERLKNQMSLWLRNQVRSVYKFGELMRELKLFFRNAEEKFPTQQSKRSFQTVTAEFNSPKIYRSLTSSSVESTSSPSSSRFGEVAIHASRNPPKRMKISLIENAPSLSNVNTETSTKEFIVMLKKKLPEDAFPLFIKTMQSYKESVDWEQLRANLEEIFKHRNHLKYLIRGLEGYIRDQHVAAFVEYCSQNC